MVVKYLYSGDELPQHPATTFDDDSTNWWGGVFLNGVQIVLATALAVSSAQGATARQQWVNDDQIPAGNLHSPANEDYWQNPTPPVPLSFYQQLPLTDQEQFPAGGLHGQPDEDFHWQQLLPPPVPLTFGKLYLPDPDEIPAGTLHGQFDEDFWPQQLLPVPIPFALGNLYLPDSDSTPASGLHGQPDEDFWINPVQSVPLSFLTLQQWGFDEETPTLTAAFSPIEDYWQGLATMSSLVNTGFPAWFPATDVIVPVSPPAGSSQDDRISYDKYGTGNYMSGDISIGRDQ